jgi:hypothetical protein
MTQRDDSPSVAVYIMMMMPMKSQLAVAEHGGLNMDMQAGTHVRIFTVRTGLGLLCDISLPYKRAVKTKTKNC